MIDSNIVKLKELKKAFFFGVIVTMISCNMQIKKENSIKIAKDSIPVSICYIDTIKITSNKDEILILISNDSIRMKRGANWFIYSVQKDSAGNILCLKKIDKDESYIYHYDSINRLLKFEHLPYAHSVLFDYDTNNRISQESYYVSNYKAWVDKISYDSAGLRVVLDRYANNGELYKKISIQFDTMYNPYKFLPDMFCPLIKQLGFALSWYNKNPLKAIVSASVENNLQPTDTLLWSYEYTAEQHPMYIKQSIDSSKVQFTYHCVDSVNN